MILGCEKEILPVPLGVLMHVLCHMQFTLQNRFPQEINKLAFITLLQSFFHALIGVHQRLGQ